MTTTQELIDTLGLTITRTRRGKSTMTSGDRFNVVVRRGETQIDFPFHDNSRNESSGAEMFGSLVLDAQGFLSSDSVDDFAEDFCLEIHSMADARAAQQAFEDCGEALMKLMTLGLSRALVEEIEAL